MAPPRILTFNFHEPYLCLMAKTGFDFDVGLYAQGALGRTWNQAHRPKPDNLTLIEEPQWRETLNQGGYDVVIAHNENNALDIVQAPAAKLLVCHNRRTFLRSNMTADQGDPVEIFDRLLRSLRHYFEFIFISESKRDDYALPGRVILPGIDVEDFGGYTGENLAILRVGNVMRSRNLMFDVDVQEAVCQGLANRVLGHDPKMPSAAPAASFDELLQAYQSHRCLLHVTREAYEDGYNLAMLEAMACGMPIVSLANYTSPITDGVDGFVSYSVPVLRQRVLELLENPERARELGARGRESVAAKFPISAFVERWRAAILEAAENQPARPTLPRRSKRKNILMHYVASPFTTARYFEFAARPQHNVLGVGPRLPENMLRTWGFTAEIPPYAAHQIPLPSEASCEALIHALPQGYRGDFYLWIDSGIRAPEHLDLLPMPKVAYLIDTHVALEPRIEVARQFDLVFIAQKAQLEAFRRAGIERVQWLPLACSTTLHALPPRERIYDVAYVGSLNMQDGGRRKRLLSAVGERFPNCRIGQFWPEEMAEIYAQSKIVVNAAHNDDVNMRVFEAMGAGALLLTDPVTGLEDLFTDGEQLVVYRRDSDVFNLIERYLSDNQERERIARAGQAAVMSMHTYEHRIKTITSELQQALPEIEARKSAAQAKEQDYYEHPRYEVMQYIPQRARRILDVGCGAGVLGRTLKRERGDVEVVGVELIEAAWRKAVQVLDQVVPGSIEDLDLPFPDGYFDCIVCADVLEHLVDPAAVLRKLGRVLAPSGLIIISIPNVRFHEVVSMLVSGGWSYADAGILDSTHLRFFTEAELEGLVRAAGLEAARIAPLSKLSPDRFPRNADGSVSLHKLTLSGVTDAEYEQFLVYQYVVLAGHPGVDHLAEARAALDRQQNEQALLLAVDAQGGDEAEQRRIMAKAFVRLGKLDRAELMFRESLERRANPEVEGEFGILLLGVNRLDEAKPLLERALTACPGSARVLGAMGLVHLTENRFQEAFEAFHKALSTDFEHISLLPHLIASARNAGRLEAAEDVLKAYAEFYPGNFSLACARGELLIELGRGAEAREVLETVLLFAPGLPEALALIDRLG